MSIKAINCSGLLIICFMVRNTGNDLTDPYNVKPIERD